MWLNGSVTLSTYIGYRFNRLGERFLSAHTVSQFTVEQCLYAREQSRSNILSVVVIENLLAAKRFEIACWRSPRSMGNPLTSERIST